MHWSESQKSLRLRKAFLDMLKMSIINPNDYSNYLEGDDWVVWHIWYPIWGWHLESLKTYSCTLAFLLRLDVNVPVCTEKHYQCGKQKPDKNRKISDFHTCSCLSMYWIIKITTVLITETLNKLNIIENVCIIYSTCLTFLLEIQHRML